MKLTLQERVELAGFILLHGRLPDANPRNLRRQAEIPRTATWFAEQARRRAERISIEQLEECPECPKCGCNEVILLQMPQLINSPAGGAAWPVPGKAWCSNCNLTFRVQFDD